MSMNIVVLTGRLTAAPELKQTQSDISVTSFSIANDTGYGDNKKTNFINCVAWKKTAELICNHFTKGSLIGIEGQIQTRSYEDKDGKKRTVFEVLVNNVQFLEPKAKSTQSYVGSNEPMEEVLLGDDELPF